MGAKAVPVRPAAHSVPCAREQNSVLCVAGASAAACALVTRKSTRTVRELAARRERVKYVVLVSASVRRVTSTAALLPSPLAAAVMTAAPSSALPTSSFVAPTASAESCSAGTPDSSRAVSMAGRGEADAVDVARCTSVCVGELVAVGELVPDTVGVGEADAVGEGVAEEVCEGVAEGVAEDVGVAVDDGVGVGEEEAVGVTVGENVAVGDHEALTVALALTVVLGLEPTEREAVAVDEDDTVGLGLERKESEAVALGVGLALGVAVIEAVAEELRVRVRDSEAVAEVLRVLEAVLVGLLVMDAVEEGVHVLERVLVRERVPVREPERDGVGDADVVGVPSAPAADMSALSSTGKLGVPKPVTGSQPGAAAYPLQPHLLEVHLLLPVVTSVKAAGTAAAAAYSAGFTKPSGGAPAARSASLARPSIAAIMGAEAEVPSKIMSPPRLF